GQRAAPARRWPGPLPCSAALGMSASSPCQFHEAEQAADAVGRYVPRAVPQALAGPPQSGARDIDFQRDDGFEAGARSPGDGQRRPARFPSVTDHYSDRVQPGLGRFVFVPDSATDEIDGCVLVEAAGPPGVPHTVRFGAGGTDEGLDIVAPVVVESVLAAGRAV